MAIPACSRPWPTLEIDAIGFEIKFAGSELPVVSACLRLTLALDMAGTSFLVIESLDGETELAQVDLRYGCMYQMFSTPLSLGAANRMALETVRLRVVRGQPVTFFTADVLSDLPPEFAPHIFPSGQAASSSAVLPRLASPAALQPFNWLHGCVVDALADADDKGALNFHLGHWFHDDGHLRYFGPHNEPRIDELFGLEPVLMFSALVRHDPQHPAFGVLRHWLKKHTEADGLIIDRGLDAEGLASPVTWISIEAIYTVAYPLALMANTFDEPSWKDLAVQQIQHRLRHLVKNGVVCQRAPLGGEGEQPHWGRANAWFILGLVKTFRALGSHSFVNEGVEILREHAARLLERQRPDGLWSVYLDDPEAGSDTSASAGIAAALAISANEGWLGTEALDAARRADESLATFLTPDGFLGGAAQLNRGGDALQRGGYRVLGQFALGLYGQLRTALSHSSP